MRGYSLFQVFLIFSSIFYVIACGPDSGSRNGAKLGFAAAESTRGTFLQLQFKNDSCPEDPSAGKSAPGRLSPPKLISSPFGQKFDLSVFEEVKSLSLRGVVAYARARDIEVYRFPIDYPKCNYAKNLDPAPQRVLEYAAKKLVKSYEAAFFHKGEIDEKGYILLGTVAERGVLIHELMHFAFESSAKISTHQLKKKRIEKQAELNTKRAECISSHFVYAACEAYSRSAINMAQMIKELVVRQALEEAAIESFLLFEYARHEFWATSSYIDQAYRYAEASLKKGRDQLESAELLLNLLRQILESNPSSERSDPKWKALLNEIGAVEKEISALIGKVSRYLNLGIHEMVKEYETYTREVELTAK